LFIGSPILVVPMSIPLIVRPALAIGLLGLLIMAPQLGVTGMLVHGSLYGQPPRRQSSAEIAVQRLLHLSPAIGGLVPVGNL